MSGTLVEAQIRLALKALLEPVDGVRGHIVFDTVDIPEDDENLWVSVSIGDELISQISLGTPATGAKQEHTLEVNIDILTVNRLGEWVGAEKVLQAFVPLLFTDRTIGGLVKTFTAVAKRRDKTLDGQPVARLRLQCQTVFHTFDRDPTRSV